MTLLLGAAVLATACASVAPPPGHGVPLAHGPHESARLYQRRGEYVPGTEVALASPTAMAVRTVTSGAVQVDTFEQLLALAGLDDFNEELLRRVERFNTVAVLRPDGYLAWTLNGRTQQKVGPVDWKDDAFRAGPFELGHFYTRDGWVFRRADTQLRPVMSGPPLAEVYDDADYVGRTLDGAEESFVELYHAMGQLLTRPSDSIAALRHLPAGVAALIASSPEYLEHLRYMTRGEQVKAFSKLTAHLIVTFGAAGGTTRTLTQAFEGAEATVPVLSLSAEGALVMERIVVPVGKVATVLSGGPGAAIILQRANAGEQTPSPAPEPGQWGPGQRVHVRTSPRLPGADYGACGGRVLLGRWHEHQGRRRQVRRLQERCVAGSQGARFCQQVPRRSGPQDLVQELGREGSRQSGQAAAQGS